MGVGLASSVSRSMRGAKGRRKKEDGKRGKKGEGKEKKGEYQIIKYRDIRALYYKSRTTLPPVSDRISF